MQQNTDVVESASLVELRIRDMQFFIGLILSRQHVYISYLSQVELQSTSLFQPTSKGGSSCNSLIRTTRLDRLGKSCMNLLL